MVNYKIKLYYISATQKPRLSGASILPFFKKKELTLYEDCITIGISSLHSFTHVLARSISCNFIYIYKYKSIRHP